MELYKTKIKGFKGFCPITETIYMNLDNITAIYPSDDGKAVIRCTGQIQETGYFLDEPFEETIRRIKLGELI